VSDDAGTHVDVESDILARRALLGSRSERPEHSSGKGGPAGFVDVRMETVEAVARAVPSNAYETDPSGQYQGSKTATAVASPAD